jgi:hypothetical protein
VINASVEDLTAIEGVDEESAGQMIELARKHEQVDEIEESDEDSDDEDADDEDSDDESDEADEEESEEEETGEEASDEQKAEASVE